MNEKFFDLKKEKQDRIINAALKIFAENGYRHASTDDIVVEAGISKGLLFHYFGSKIGLYAFLYDYCGRFLSLELSSSVQSSDSDYFSIMKSMEEAKVSVVRNYPYLQMFIDSSQTEDAREAIDITEQMRSELQTTYDKILNQVDDSPFNQNVDAAAVHSMLTYTLRGLMSDQLQTSVFNADAYRTESLHYIEMMKSVCY